MTDAELANALTVIDANTAQSENAEELRALFVRWLEIVTQRQALDAELNELAAKFQELK